MISFIDLDVRIVPDVISLPGIVLGFGFSIVGYFTVGPPAEHTTIPSPLSSFIGILAGGGFLLATAWIYEKFTGVEGMGGGDIKLLAMIGAFLGWPSVPVTLFIASMLGSVIGLICMADHRRGSPAGVTVRAVSLFRSDIVHLLRRRFDSVVSPILVKFACHAGDALHRCAGVAVPRRFCAPARSSIFSSTTTLSSSIRSRRRPVHKSLTLEGGGVGLQRGQFGGS